MRVHALPALQDNYIWLLAGSDGAALVVDPGEAGPVLQAVAEGLRPLAILITHHHPDHQGGAAELARRLGIPRHAPFEERIPDAEVRVAEGDRLDFPALSLQLQVMQVHGHTRSHVAFHGGGHLFCGDALFSLGCGRMFEGQPAQMLDSLDRLAALPGDLQVCCGHEYTEANGRFARAVEPDNATRDHRLDEVRARRARQQPSLPVSLSSERDCNPFLRLDQPGVQASLSHRLGRAPADRIEAFATLRHWKDTFAA
ncbi:hydroxyacylglutathione hydrolase [Arenimonas sp. MALMAid1274]|uniref:hydroxyacylglutathione hydrolase n=1 Tax=Arenimonas sp. MALMAid1274 TaxID=3411630 RepID=UPI003BA236F5